MKKFTIIGMTCIAILTSCSTEKTVTINDSSVETIAEGREELKKLYEAGEITELEKELGDLSIDILEISRKDKKNDIKIKEKIKLVSDKMNDMKDVVKESLDEPDLNEESTVEYIYIEEELGKINEERIIEVENKFVQIKEEVEQIKEDVTEEEALAEISEIEEVLSKVENLIIETKLSNNMNQIKRAIYDIENIVDVIKMKVEQMN